jgi:hypothetical protein
VLEGEGGGWRSCFSRLVQVTIEARSSTSSAKYIHMRKTIPLICVNLSWFSWVSWVSWLSSGVLSSNIEKLKFQRLNCEL